MTAASLTITTPTGGSVLTAGRNVYNEGNRRVARFRVTIIDTYATGGVACDFRPYIDFVPTEVRFSPHVLLASVLLIRYIPAYDFVNRKVLLLDVEEGNEPDSEDVTGLAFDVVVVSE